MERGKGRGGEGGGGRGGGEGRRGEGRRVGNERTAGLRFVSQMTISSYRLIKNNDPLPLSKHGKRIEKVWILK